MYIYRVHFPGIVYIMYICFVSLYTNLKTMYMESNDMKEAMRVFLAEHPELTIKGIEAKLGINKGTIRITEDGRGVPEKYRVLVRGYIDSYVQGVHANGDVHAVGISESVVTVGVDKNTGEMYTAESAKVPPVKQREVVTKEDLSQNVTGRTSHGYPMPDPVRLARARLVLAEMEHKMGIASYEDMNQPVFVKEVVPGRETLAVMAYKEATTVVPEGMVECVFIDDRIRRAVRYSGAYGYWDSHVVVDIPDDEEVLISKTWRVMYRGNIGNRQITDGGKSIFYRDAISEGTIVYVPVGVFK